jgi:hypothetical protein
LPSRLRVICIIDCCLLLNTTPSHIPLLSSNHANVLTDINHYLQMQRVDKLFVHIVQLLTNLSTYSWFILAVHLASSHTIMTTSQFRLRIFQNTNGVLSNLLSLPVICNLPLPCHFSASFQSLRAAQSQGAGPFSEDEIPSILVWPLPPSHRIPAHLPR